MSSTMATAFATALGVSALPACMIGQANFVSSNPNKVSGMQKKPVVVSLTDENSVPRNLAVDHMNSVRALRNKRTGQRFASTLTLYERNPSLNNPLSRALRTSELRAIVLENLGHGDLVDIEIISAWGQTINAAERAFYALQVEVLNARARQLQVMYSTLTPTQRETSSPMFRLAVTAWSNFVSATKPQQNARPASLAKLSRLYLETERTFKAFCASMA